MNPISRLRRTADEAERQAAQLEAKAARLREMAAGVRAAVAKALTEGEHTAKVSRDMVDAHRVAISAGRRNAKDKFLAHVNARGYTMRSLAAALGIKDPTLIAHRKAKGTPNARPIPQSRADRIAELTDWPADAAHWPAGITSD